MEVQGKKETIDQGGELRRHNLKAEPEDREKSRKLPAIIAGCPPSNVNFPLASTLISARRLSQGPQRAAADAVLLVVLTVTAIFS